MRPLSAFGFPDDHWEQQVRWYPPAEGLRTVEALRQGVASQPPVVSEVAADLDALAVVLRAAAEQDVNFSLVLRLHARDSMQMVSTREVRQGSFW